MFKTLIWAVPVARREVGTCAVNWVALTKVVGSAAPFQATVAPAKKLLPLTVSVKGGLPGKTDVGLRLVMRGVTAAFTVKIGACGKPARPGWTPGWRAFPRWRWR